MSESSSHSEDYTRREWGALEELAAFVVLADLDRLALPDGAEELPGAVEAPRFKGAVLFDRVSFSYRHGPPVLSELTLEIPSGQRVALVGPTGSGKTTLVSLLPRFYDCTGGRVCLDGRAVREFTLASLRKHISLVFQEPVLFAATIAENIAYGKPEATMDEIVQAARLAGIHPIITALPVQWQRSSTRLA